MTTLGIIGAGLIGSQLARIAVANDYDVVISNSRGPETLADLVAELGPRAKAATAQEAGTAGDIVVVTVPLNALEQMPVEALSGKIVLDTLNYYSERDGHIDALDKGETTTSEIVQQHLPTSKVVKAFNHIYAAEISTDSTPAGTPNRRALATAGADADAIAFVTHFYDLAGFDTVNLGPLSESWRVERDRPPYVVRQTAEELRASAATANRVPDLAVRSRNEK